MTTLTRLIAKLSNKYGVSKRPLRYFDVPKRGELTPSEIKYATQRFEDLMFREFCVEEDPSNPKCYAKVESDQKPRRKKRKSSYLKDYEAIFRTPKVSDTEFFKTNAKAITKLKAQSPSSPKGLLRVALETGLPIVELKEVYDIGRGAYASSGSRTGMTAEQWGYGRVYAFIMSYFFNQKGEYSDSRFLKNRTDEHIFRKIESQLH